MKKHTLVVAIVFLLSLFGCSFGPGNAPDLFIHSGETVFAYQAAENLLQGQPQDHEDSFQKHAAKKGDYQYLALGESIELEFTKKGNPDSYHLYDFILNEDGTQKYAKEMVREIPLTFQDGMASFLLEPNPAALLSSQSADYGSGGILRGFRLVCAWGEDEYEYVFMLKTDASETTE